VENATNKKISRRTSTTPFKKIYLVDSFYSRYCSKRQQTALIVMDPGATTFEFFTALYELDLARVRLLLGGNRTLANQEDDDEHNNKWPPILWASYKGQADALRLLLQHGADPNILSAKYDCTPLILASTKSDPRAVQVLLEYGADVNVPNSKGRTALLVAAGKGHAEVVQLLLHHGADANRCDRSGESPLQLAARYGSVDVARLLVVQHSDTHHNARNKYGDTPLHTAMKKKKANLYFGGGDYPSIDFKKEKVVELLLDHGFRVNVQNNLGDTPLLIAIEQQREFKVVQLLLLHGADANLQKGGDNNGYYTPLWLASNLNRPHVVELLLDHGANVDDCVLSARYENGGSTALLRAVEKGHVECVRVLVKRGANPNAPNQNHVTPLIQACQTEDLNLIYLLIRVMEPCLPNDVTSPYQQ
jgi:ankyrin repeat protein